MSTYHQCISQAAMFSTVYVNTLLRRTITSKSTLHQFSRTFPKFNGGALLNFSTKTTENHNPTNSADKQSSATKPGIKPSPLPNPQNGVKDRLLEKMTTGKVGEVVSAFEEFLGIGDVKRAQAKLIKLENKFTDARKDVQNSSGELTRLQGELRAVRAKLDRTTRDNPHFLELATEEHHLLQSETNLREGHNKSIVAERTIFQDMGIALRDSYEKQRVQEERSKYWSLILGLTTGVIAFIGSTIVNHRRMRTLQTMVIDQIHAITGENPVGESTTLGTALGSLAETHNSSLEAQTKTFQELLTKQEGKFAEELRRIGIKEPLGVAEMLNENHAKLEWEVKMSTLSTVVLIYGAFALTLPILYTIFK